MRDFKYKQIITGTPSWEGEASTIKSDFLKPWLDIFTENMVRTANLAAMPMMIAFYVRRDQLFTSNATFRTTGKSESTLHDIMLQPFSDDIKVELEKQMDELNSLPKNEQNGIRLNLGAGYINTGLQFNIGLQSAMDAIFTSIVLESWTAFESLASDIWVAAVDNGPQSLANRVALSKDLKKVDPITVKVLHELEYDVRKQLGMFLRETRRVSFQSLENIKSAYNIAFGDDGSDIIASTNQGYIEALAAFRNIFAHKLGVADKDFVRQVQRFPEFRSIRRDERIYLDGEVVSKLRDASATSGLALVRFVDDAINNPPK